MKRLFYDNPRKRACGRTSQSHQGLHKMKRRSPGPTSSTDTFHQEVTKVSKGRERRNTIHDNMLEYGADEEEHNRNKVARQEKHAQVGRCRQRDQGPNRTNRGIGGAAVQAVRRPRGPHPGPPAATSRQRHTYQHKTAGAKNGDETRSGNSEDERCGLRALDSIGSLGLTRLTRLRLTGKATRGAEGRGGPGRGPPETQGGREGGQEAHRQGHGATQVGPEGVVGAGGAALQGGEGHRPRGATQELRRGPEGQGGGPRARCAPGSGRHQETAEAGARDPKDRRGRREEGQGQHAQPGRCRQQGQGPTQTNQGHGGAVGQPVRRPQVPHSGRPEAPNHQRRPHQHKLGGAKNGDKTSSHSNIHDNAYQGQIARNEVHHGRLTHNNTHHGQLARDDAHHGLLTVAPSRQ